MILLDTNVISEIVNPSPSPAVISWLNEQDSATLYLSAIVLAEIRYGVEAIPDGKRKQALSVAVDTFVDRAFADRILPFDRKSARLYGTLMADRRRAGQPLSAPDGQIAATASSRDFQLATRNIKDFTNCGLVLVNPFEHVPRQ
ncbi:MAG: putative nucleic acid-binding protein [Candidatus Poriferisodalaceae bacterium]|jgi:predicted nucleic acid-binding protein